MRYISNISTSVRTTWKGMSLAIRYFFDARKKRKKEWVGEENYFTKAEGTFTVQYPKESIPIPDNGRYQLHNEIDDCIVCDKCAKICPVDCIDIEPIRSPEVFGHTSDGTPKRIHAAKFDIDMAKCCFCGLCTVVCPTECLTMTKEFDFSTHDILDHNFSFSKMSDQEIAEKKKEFEDFQAAKSQPKTGLPEIGKKAVKPAIPSVPKPVVKPGKPVVKPRIDTTLQDAGKKAPAKPVIKPSKPVVKPLIKSKTTDASAGNEQRKPAKPVIKPVIKPAAQSTSSDGSSEEPKGEASSKKVNKPVLRPKIPKKK